MKVNSGTNISTAISLLRNEYHNISAYKISLFINIIYSFLMMYSIGYVWRTLYATNPKVVGIPLSKMISYAVLGVALEAILHPSNGPQNYIMEQVRKGTIEMDIVKPVDFQFYMFFKNLGGIIARVLLLVIPSVITAFLLFSLQFPRAESFLLFLLSLSLSIIISFFLNFTLGLISIVTMNIKNINWGYNALLRFFSGQMVPLWLFPTPLEEISVCLPFRCIYATPVSIYIGGYTGKELSVAIIAQIIWSIMLFVISRIVMKCVFTRVRIQGG